MKKQGIVVALVELAEAYNFGGCMQYNLGENPSFRCGFSTENGKLIGAILNVCTTFEVSFSVKYSGMGAVNIVVSFD